MFSSVQRKCITRVGHASVELLPGAAAGLTTSAVRFPPQRFAPDASCPMGYF